MSSGSGRLAGRVWLLALLGVTVFLAGLGLLGTALVEGQLLPGGGALARGLEAEQIPFVVIDAKPELERDLQRGGVLYLIGSPSSEPVLRQAGVERARGLVCAVDSDAENVYITLVARRGGPESRLEELLVPDGSQLAGRCLGEVLGGAIPLLVRRASGELLPNPGQATTLEAGDVVVVFGEPGTLRPIEGG